jgi:hypothetical protein
MSLFARTPTRRHLHPVRNVACVVSTGNTVTVTTPPSQTSTVGTAASLQAQVGRRLVKADPATSPTVPAVLSARWPRQRTDHDA